MTMQLYSYNTERHTRLFVLKILEHWFESNTLKLPFDLTALDKKHSVASRSDTEIPQFITDVVTVISFAN